MPEVKINLLGAFHQLAGGKTKFTVKGHDVKDAINMLEVECPGLLSRILESDSSVKRHINIYLNDDHIDDLQALDTPIKIGDSILVLPAIAGG